MELTWSHDYCLACDKQTAGETYCSQFCRLADLETSTNRSGTTSPASSAPSPSWASSDSNRGSGFYLSPAINFASYKPAETNHGSALNHAVSPQSSYFTGSSSTQSTRGRTLSPSSSHSSLSSTQSTSSQPNHISEQARTELRAYTDSFDHTRNWRRRKT